MSSKFAIGDVVALKSSGVTMTVHGHGDVEPAVVHCRWFDQYDMLREANFLEAALRRHEQSMSADAS